MKYLLIIPIRLYQLTLSKIMPPVCRYHPSCSRYSLEAIQRYGFFKGGWLMVKRLARCQPFGGSGYDPVP